MTCHGWGPQALPSLSEPQVWSSCPLPVPGMAFFLQNFLETQHEGVLLLLSSLPLWVRPSLTLLPQEHRAGRLHRGQDTEVFAED